MRLGIDDTSLAVDCAQALAAGGIDELIVHGRTKADGYRPPARWAWIDRVRAAIDIPLIANGEVWTVEDFVRCQQETGCADIMLGRGAIADPLLARRARGEAIGGWDEVAPGVAAYWQGVRRKVVPASCRRADQAMAGAAAPQLPRGRGALPAPAADQGGA